jgi:hypothetical protein
MLRPTQSTNSTSFAMATGRGDSGGLPRAVPHRRDRGCGRSRAGREPSGPVQATVGCGRSGRRGTCGGRCPWRSGYSPRSGRGGGRRGGRRQGLLIGEENLEAVAVDVGEAELGAGMRHLAAADGSSSGRPGAEVHVQLAAGGLVEVARLAFPGDGGHPGLLGCADMATRFLEVRPTTGGRQFARCGLLMPRLHHRPGR